VKDAGQKELLYRHFRARGWYALIEVPVYNRGGESGNKYQITDIDVFALRPSPDLRWEAVIGDCKTKKGESPANRVLWARALMDQFGATSGIVLLRRDPKKAIEPDHKLFAQKLGIALIEEPDFEVYDRAMLYPSGSATTSESAAALQSIRMGTCERFPKLSPLYDYIKERAWNEPDHFMLLRNSIGHGLKVRSEIDPGRDDHLAFVLEAAGVFAVALATCVGIVFHQYLQTNQRQALDGALKTIMWGGREQYDYISGIWAKLVEAKGGAEEHRDVSLPAWNTFLQLVRSHTDAPHFSFQIPQLLRVAALDIMGSRPFLASLGSPDPMLLKLGMLTASYYIEACRLPLDAKTRVKELFGRRIATVAIGASSAAPLVSAERVPTTAASISLPPPPTINSGSSSPIEAVTEATSLRGGDGPAQASGVSSSGTVGTAQTALPGIAEPSRNR
jgi:hypothetical protein